MGNRTAGTTATGRAAGGWEAGRQPEDEEELLAAGDQPTGSIWERMLEALEDEPAPLIADEGGNALRASIGDRLDVGPRRRPRRA
jgi:hypothetical protein